MPGKVIRGITIEINGISTKLDKALEAPEKKAKSLEAELKKVDKALKLDPKNTELLAQKQQILKEAIQQTKTKLDTLKDAQKQAVVSIDKYDDWKAKYTPIQEEIEKTQKKLAKLKDKSEEAAKALAAGEISTEEYEALQSEIKETETSLEGLRTEAKAVNDEFGNPISPEQYRGLQQEIITTEQNLKDLEKKAKECTSSMQNIADVTKKVGDKSVELGKKIMPASAGVTALGVGAAKSAIDYETAFAGVKKTTDELIDANGNVIISYEDLSDGIREMAGRLPQSAAEIAGVAEAAGQLGVATDDLLDFTETMVMLGDTTNLSSDEAAMSIAKFTNITGLSHQEVDRLGSTLVELGNTTATTEADILNMATGLASAGSQVGMSDAEILGLSASLSSLGLETQAGGSAFSRVMKQMQIDVEMGSGNIENFAAVAGMSVEEFSTLFETNAAEALNTFIAGLGDTENMGMSTIAMLDEMGITELRMSDALMRTSNSSELLTSTLDTARGAWESDNALKDEAAKRYETMESQIALLKNAVVELGIEFGEILMPYIKKLVDIVKTGVKWFSNLTDENKKLIVKIGGLVAALGPALLIFGKLSQSVSGSINAVTNIGNKITDLASKMKSAAAAGGGFGGAMSSLFSPAGWVAIGATAAVILGTAIYKHVTAPTREATEGMKKMAASMVTFSSDLESAKGHLSSYSGTFEQLNAQQESARQSISDAQAAITGILQKAVDDRSSITQEDIDNLKSYYEQIEAENNRIVEIERNKMSAIVEIEAAQAQNHEGSLAEYKTYAINAVATAREQADSTNAVLQQQSVDELAALQQRYESLMGTEAEMSSQQYEAEKNAIIQSFDEQQRLTNDGIGRVAALYANGYTERINQDTAFSAQVNQYHVQMKAAKDQYNADMLAVEEMRGIDSKKALQMEWDATHEYKNSTTSSWNTLTRELSDEQQAQIGNMVAFAVQTQLYGGKLDAETQSQVDAMVGSWKDLPQKSKDTMRDTLQPMLDEMKAKSPELYAQMTATGDNVISSLQDAVGVQSPSWKTRAIMSDVMAGAEIGLENKKTSLLDKAKGIAESVIETLNKAFDRNSPAGVTISMFEDVGEGMIVGLDNMHDQITRTAESIGVSATEAMRKPLETRLSAMLSISSILAENPSMISSLNGGNIVLPLTRVTSSLQKDVGQIGTIEQNNNFYGCNISDATENARKIRNETRRLHLAIQKG